MKVTSIRIPREIDKAMKFVACREKIEKIHSLRKLAMIGFEYYVAHIYKSGSLSLREAAKLLELPLSTTIELFADMGVKGNTGAADVEASLKSLIAHPQ